MGGINAIRPWIFGPMVQRCGSVTPPRNTREVRGASNSGEGGGVCVHKTGGPIGGLPNECARP